MPQSRTGVAPVWSVQQGMEVRQVLTKTCNNCGDTLYMERFYVDNKRADGHQNTCMDCQKSRHKDKGVVANNRLLKGWARA